MESEAYVFDEEVLKKAAELGKPGLVDIKQLHDKFIFRLEGTGVLPVSLGEDVSVLTHGGRGHGRQQSGHTHWGRQICEKWSGLVGFASVDWGPDARSCGGCLHLVIKAAASLLAGCCCVRHSHCSRGWCWSLLWQQ